MVELLLLERLLQARVVGHGRDVAQGRIVLPSALDDHLHESHRAECGGEPARLGRRVDHGLEHADRLVEHGLEVGCIVADRQVESTEVALQQHVRLHERRVECGGVDRPSHRDVHLRIHLVFVVSHRQLGELVRECEHFEHLLRRRARLQSLGEDDHGLVVQVVEGCDLSHRERHDRARLLLLHDEAGSLEVVEHAHDELHQVLVQLLARDILEAVVARVEQESSEEERPREVVEEVGHGSDRARRADLGVDVVVQLTEQAALDGEGRVEEVEVEVLREEMREEKER